VNIRPKKKLQTEMTENDQIGDWNLNFSLREANEEKIWERCEKESSVLGHFWIPNS
jgi:hypothetical protein